MKQFDTDTEDMQMPDDYKPTYIKEQHNNNCQQFFGPITNCTFTMPATSSSSSRKTKPAKLKKSERKPNGKPKTLIYFKHGNNGILMKQRKRVHIVYRKFIEWKWIDEKTNPEDFDAFFEGEPRHCNISWTGNTTILTILLQELIKQPYIEKQTGCAAKSLVEQQFGKIANSDRTRLDNAAEERINAILYILDIRNPLDIRGGENELNADTVDDSLILVYAELFAGQLHSTKGI